MHIYDKNDVNVTHNYGHLSDERKPNKALPTYEDKLQLATLCQVYLVQMNVYVLFKSDTE
jgi:hypothetical protein